MAKPLPGAYAFLENIEKLGDLNDPKLINNNSSSIRALLCKTLKIAMNDNNQEAIYAILDFCLEFHFILFIQTEDLEMLIETE